jgi:hypothetical protein
MAVKIWERTTALRFLRPVLEGFWQPGKLQQGWRSETGEIEWRDVEIVTEGIDSLTKSKT